MDKSRKTQLNILEKLKMIKKIIITIESIALVICLSILGNLYNKYSYFLLYKKLDELLKIEANLIKIGNKIGG